MTEATNAPADPLREALAVGEQFLNKCNAAWAAGEPSHRVNDMLDAADKFRDALEALSATREEGGAIPAGMKAWAGGDSAPDDWDGAPVLMESVSGWRTFALPDRAGDERWLDFAGDYKVVAYTPKAQAPSDHRMSASEASLGAYIGETSASNAKYPDAGEVAGGPLNFPKLQMWKPDDASWCDCTRGGRHWPAGACSLCGASGFIRAQPGPAASTGSPFDLSDEFFPREHALHCFACGGAIGTRTCSCQNYSLPRNLLTSALEWARRDGMALSTDPQATKDTPDAKA